MDRVVTTEDICETASLKSDESFPLRRLKLDVIARILGMGDLHNSNDINNNYNHINLEDEFNSLRETMKKELSSGSDIIEDYLSLLQRKGFIEYDYRGNNKVYRTTARGLFVLQLYQKAAMWLY
jgi:hypothetical protein